MIIFKKSVDQNVTICVNFMFRQLLPCLDIQLSHETIILYYKEKQRIGHISHYLVNPFSGGQLEQNYFVIDKVSGVIRLKSPGPIDLSENFYTLNVTAKGNDRKSSRKSIEKKLSQTIHINIFSLYVFFRLNSYSVASFSELYSI